MIYTLYAFIIALLCWVGWLKSHLDHYRASATFLANEVVALRADNARLTLSSAQKPLTATKPKAQDTPKPLTGAQLRRMAEQANSDAMASLQERPNSEILQEHDNG